MLRNVQTMTLATMMLVPRFAWAQVDESAYQPLSIGEICKKHSYMADKGLDLNFNAAFHKYQTDVIYQGSVREISGPRLDFLRGQRKSWPHLDRMLSMYKHEILVTQAEIPYWLPIQEGLLQELKGCRQKGQHMKIYFVVAGTVKTEFIFQITRFDELD